MKRRSGNNPHISLVIHWWKSLASNPKQLPFSRSCPKSIQVFPGQTVTLTSVQSFKIIRECHLENHTATILEQDNPHQNFFKLSPWILNKCRKPTAITLPNYTTPTCPIMVYSVVGHLWKMVGVTEQGNSEQDFLKTQAWTLTKLATELRHCVRTNSVNICQHGNVGQK